MMKKPRSKILRQPNPSSNAPRKGSKALGGMCFLRTIAGYSRGEDSWKLCVKMVDLLFGHADLILGLVGFFDGKLREEIQRNCRFAIDDVMDEREVMRCRLERCIECAEDALRLAPPDQWLSRGLQLLLKQRGTIEANHLERILPQMLLDF